MNQHNSEEIHTPHGAGAIVLCDSCLNAVECLGQGIYGTDACTRWELDVQLDIT